MPGLARFIGFYYLRRPNGALALPTEIDLRKWVGPVTYGNQHIPLPVSCLGLSREFAICVLTER